MIHTTRRIGAAINQITEEDKCVRRWIARQHIYEVEELRATTVNVADDISLHSEWSPVDWRCVLMFVISSMKRGSLCISVQLGSDSNHGVFSFPRPIAVSSQRKASTCLPCKRYAE